MLILENRSSIRILDSKEKEVGKDRKTILKLMVNFLKSDNLKRIIYFKRKSLFKNIINLLYSNH